MSTEDEMLGAVARCLDGASLGTREVLLDANAFLLHPRRSSFKTI